MHPLSHGEAEKIAMLIEKRMTQMPGADDGSAAAGPGREARGDAFRSSFEMAVGKDFDKVENATMHVEKVMMDPRLQGKAERLVKRGFLHVSHSVNVLVRCEAWERFLGGQRVTLPPALAPQLFDDDSSLKRFVTALVAEVSWWLMIAGVITAVAADALCFVLRLQMDGIYSSAASTARICCSCSSLRSWSICGARRAGFTAVGVTIVNISRARVPDRFPCWHCHTALISCGCRAGWCRSLLLPSCYGFLVADE